MVTAARVTTFGAAFALLVGLVATVGLPATPPARREDDDADDVAPELQPVGD